MPSVPDRLCPRHGRVPGGKPCQQCQQERQRAADTRRGTARERGYDARWAKASRQHLAEFPWCERCRAQGRMTLAECTDHIRPHKGDMALFWDPSNWQSLCLRCNTLKAIKQEGGFGNTVRSTGSRG
jgi:5-methylcytosine-specific restriction protein A